MIWRASAPRPPEVDRYFLHDLGPGGRAAVVPISDDEIYLWMLQHRRRRARARRPGSDSSCSGKRLAAFGGVVPIVAERLRPATSTTGR